MVTQPPNNYRRIQAGLASVEDRDTRVRALACLMGVSLTPLRALALSRRVGAGHTRVVHTRVVPLWCRLDPLAGQLEGDSPGSPVGMCSPHLEHHGFDRR